MSWAGYISEHLSATTNRGGSVTEQSISRLLGSSRAAFALRCETNGAERHGLWSFGLCAKVCSRPTL